MRIRTPIRRVNIGRHTILLSSDSFKFNNHAYSIGTYCDQHMWYNHVNRFIDELVKHHNETDALAVVLDAPGSQSEWFGIPGWIVRANESGLQLVESGNLDA